VYLGDEGVRRTGEDRGARRLACLRSLPDAGEPERLVGGESEEVWPLHRVDAPPFEEPVRDDHAAAAAERLSNRRCSRDALAPHVDPTMRGEPPAKGSEPPVTFMLDHRRDVFARADVVTRSEIHRGTRGHAEPFEDHLGSFEEMTGAAGGILRDGAPSDTAVDLYGFTSVLKRRLDEAERERIVSMMWELVYADGKVHEFEDNLIWRVAELLGVSSQARIRLKQAVRDNIGS